MASTKDEIEQAIRAVIDPEVGRPIGGLGMVQSVEVSRKGVAVSILLPGVGYPAQVELKAGIAKAVQGQGDNGKLEVDVSLEVMDEVAQRAVAELLLGDIEHGGAGKGALMRAGSNTRVIAISSGKGGVGKSSVSVNLAISLAQLGYGVGILDADVYGFSVPGMLGVRVPPMAIDRLVVPPKVNGVRCLSMGFFLDDDQPVIWRGPMLHKALEQFLTDAWWADPDFLIVDMPPGTGDVTLSMAEYLPKCEVFVVTTPQPAAQRVAQRSAYAAKKLKLPLRGVIENMSWFTGNDGERYEIFGSGGGQSLADSLGIPLLGQIPLVGELRAGGDDGSPITISDPQCEASLAFASIAKAIESMGATRRYRAELKVR